MDITDVLVRFSDDGQSLLLTWGKPDLSGIQIVALITVQGVQPWWLGSLMHQFFSVNSDLRRAVDRIPLGETISPISHVL